LIDEKYETMLDRVRKKGNFPAHYGQIVDKEINAVLREKREIKQPEYTPLWLDRTDAVNVLNWTVMILNHINEKSNT
jgi:hypothetical protein